MCLFHLRVQIDRRCQMLIQKLDGLSADVLGERVPGRLHGRTSKIATAAAKSGELLMAICAR
jgi:hypothetical protein